MHTIKRVLKKKREQAQQQVIDKLDEKAVCHNLSDTNKPLRVAK